MKTLHTIFLISILFIAPFSYPTHGLILNGDLIRFATVNGRLFCSVDGNLNGNSPPLSGAVVQLSCEGSTTDLGQALTNPAGFFTISVRLLDVLLFDPTMCFVRLNLPVASCSVLLPNGTALTAPISLISIVQTGVGFIGNFITGNFVNTNV